jgi:hypothetical protein
MRDPYAISTRGLCGVQRSVRLLDDLVHTPALEIGGQCQPDADTHLQGIRTRLDRPHRDCGSKIFRARRRARYITFVQNDKKFFVAITPDHVVRAHGVLPPPRHFPWDIVTHAVAGDRHSQTSVSAPNRHSLGYPIAPSSFPLLFNRHFRFFTHSPSEGTPAHTCKMHTTPKFWASPSGGKQSTCGV